MGITECKRKLTRLTATTKQTKDRESRKAAELAKKREQKDTFDKYDSDMDGRLSVEDVAAFAKAEYFFDLDEAQLDKVFAKLSPEGAEVGIAFEAFQRLRSMVAIERSVAKEREKRAQAEPDAKKPR